MLAYMTVIFKKKVKIDIMECNRAHYQTDTHSGTRICTNQYWTSITDKTIYFRAYVFVDLRSIDGVWYQGDGTMIMLSLISAYILPSQVS